jgi:hypothetical protein
MQSHAFQTHPFVRRCDQSSNETGDDHDLVHENGVENRGPRKTSGEEDIHEKKGRGDEPVDVSNVEDLTIEAGDLGV